jgi:hypothetical protein
MEFLNDPKKAPATSQDGGLKPGFAIVVVLSLMILLTVVAVGLLTLSSVSLRSASQHSGMAKARANAQLALVLALGELQKHAGPDQRVTARAEILDSDPATAAMDQVNQPYWTAAWTTGSAGLDVATGGNPPQRTLSLGALSPSILQKATSAQWLVSNSNLPLNPTTYTATTTGANPDAVVLARGQGAASSQVTVPLIKVGGSTTSQPTGRYAYWVADEGIKAKANLVDPTLGVSSITTTGQAHFLAPQANAVHKMAGLTSDGVDFRSSNSSANLGKTISRDSMKLLPSSPLGLNLKTFTPDVTVESRGVLADVKNGGLKKDLTAAFETSAGFTALTTNYVYGKQVYKNVEGLTVPYSASMTTIAPWYIGVTDGLPWATLYSYYNSYKSSTTIPAVYPGANTTTTPKTTGSLSGLPLQLSPRVVTLLDLKYSKYGGIVPEIISHRTDIALQSYEEGGMWKLRIRYLPQLVLYNPYNCRISETNFSMRRDYYTFLNTITVKVGTEEVATQVALNQANSLQRYELKTKAGQCNVLEPGETRVFGLEADAQKATLKDAINFTELTSGPNLSMDYAQWSDLPEYGGTTDKDALVDVTMSPNDLMRASSADTSITPRNMWPYNANDRIFSTDGPRMPVTPTAWTKLPISSLTTPRILVGFFLRNKGLNNSSSTKTYFNGSVVTPRFHGNAPYFTPFENMQRVIWEEFYVSPFGTPYTAESEVQSIPKTPFGPWETTYGDGSVGALDAGASRRVLRDVPNQPLVSIGQLMHMPTMVFGMSSPIVNDHPKYGFRDTGSMFIGGSMANPFIPTEFTLKESNSSSTHKNFIYDDSFLANNTLFDRFFFSTVPPPVLDAAAPQQWKDFNSANTAATVSASSPPLPNSRVKPWGKGGATPLLTELRDFDKAAANLMLDGAFNVNSTSVNAWVALLSSLSGNDLRVFKSLPGVAADISSANLKNPIPRFWSSSNSGAVNQAWDGARALSDAEVTELANRIVEQVKLRGPFLSMADFLNRRLGPVGPLTRVGCLQAAIDRTSPSINSAVKASGTLVNPTGSGMGLQGWGGANVFAAPVISENLKDGAGATLNSTVGMPGYLMQQDIVQAFSPAMTVRSDTFIIRTYGESRSSATGNVDGKAWAEAVVQRMPEFVENTADPNPETALDSLTSPINFTLGRRFKVVGFRWLSPDEI